MSNWGPACCHGVGTSSNKHTLNCAVMSSDAPSRPTCVLHMAQACGHVTSSLLDLCDIRCNESLLTFWSCPSLLPSSSVWDTNIESIFVNWHPLSPWRSYLHPPTWTWRNISTPDLHACQVLDILPGAWDMWVSCVLVACFVLMATAHHVLSYFSSHTFWLASSSFSTYHSGSSACHLSPSISIPRRGYLSLSLHRPPWPPMANPPLGSVSILPHRRIHPWLQLLIN